MNSVKCFEIRSASMVSWCIATLFIGQMLWAQETNEKVTVDEVDLCFLVWQRLPGQQRKRGSISFSPLVSG